MKILNSVRRNTNLFLILAICFLFAGPAQAAVPKLLTYQGVLKDSSANFLTGTYSMTFRIYSASTGGSALWTETQSSVSASSGKFSVQLGSVTTLSLDFNSDYWLSVQVGADAEMSPRVRLTSMGYSIRSDYENNGFTQAQHDALSHKNIEGVKDNTVMIARTNFKLDAYSSAVANSFGDMILDTFTDSSGINSGASSNYAWRGSSNYDVIVTPGGIDSYAKLVIHTNGTDASTTFTDSSSGAKTVTANGNAQIDTAQSKFGGASGLFDGTGDYLSTSSSADWDFGTGDFTIDLWFRANVFNSGTAYCFFSRNGNSDFSLRRGTDNTLQFYTEGTERNFGTWTPSTGTWYHIAIARSGSSLKCFINGTQQGSTITNSTDLQGTSSLQIGRLSSGGEEINGWIDELRVSKGIARWTTNFTSPSAEYSSSGGTATVISNATSVAAAPVEAMVIADETLNTGSITYYVSRDNGTTWTACTKETVTSISSQPSGTQLKWKVSITGDAELNAISVAV